MFTKELQQQGRELILTDVLSRTSEGMSNAMLLLPTGSGKTFITFKTLLKMNGGPGSLRIWVYEVGNVEGMYKEIKDRGLEDQFTSVEIVSYASSGKELEPVDMEMFDEIHRGLGENTSNNHKINRHLSNHKVFATATLKKKEIDKVISIFGHQDLIYKKTLQDAVNMGVVPEPNIVILRVNPDETQYTEEVKYGKKTYKVTQRKKLDKLSNDITYYRELHEKKQIELFQEKAKFPSKDFSKEEKSIYFTKMAFLRKGNNRMSYMASIKTPVIKVLKELVPGRKIIFCGSVKQAKEIGGAKHTMSSKEKDNKEKLEKFNNKEINLLTVKNKAKEGTNLVDCQTGIITQIGNQEREIIQMTGRILRHNNPIVFLVIINDSKDSSLLTQNMNTINESMVIGDYTLEDIFVKDRTNLKAIINRIYTSVV